MLGTTVKWWLLQDSAVGQERQRTCNPTSALGAEPLAPPQHTIEKEVLRYGIRAAGPRARPGVLEGVLQIDRARDGDPIVDPPQASGGNKRPPRISGGALMAEGTLPPPPPNTHPGGGGQVCSSQGLHSEKVSGADAAAIGSGREMTAEGTLRLSPPPLPGG